MKDFITDRVDAVKQHILLISEFGDLKCNTDAQSIKKNIKSYKKGYLMAYYYVNHCF